MKFYTVTYVPESGMVQQVTVAASGIQEARRRLIAAGVPVTKANSVVARAGPVSGSPPSGLLWISRSSSWPRYPCSRPC